MEINQRELRELLQGPSGPVVREVRRVGQLVLAEAQRRCPVDDGTLRASLDMSLQAGPGRVAATVGSGLEYARYVHQGTGIYGPRGRVIRPVSSKVLVFEARSARTTPRGRGGLVFAAYVRGQKPQPFLVDALRAVSPWPVREV